ncbi:MAG: DNA mismatch repair protein MutS, partial [Bacteroidetes bacterium]|nr:DNA mismatch repair protein MutS [Bacteroidota bacterium]
LLRAEGEALDPCLEAVGAIEATIADDPAGTVGQGVIRPGRSAELNELRSITGDTRQWIAGLERSERERTGVRSLKIGYNRVFGYYIEVTRPNLDATTDEYARMKTGAATVGELLESLGYQRKQTLANAERFVTTQLKEQETRLNSAQEEIEALEKQIYAELMAELSGVAARIRGTAQAMGRLDALLSLADVAVAGRYVRPVVDDSSAISLRAGRHPMVERSIPAGEYVANDCHLDSDAAQIAVLTGPNMAGKSTYVLGVALIVLMAQVGSFVPAEEARIGLVDRIFTRVGAQHDVAGGKSTFLVEMAETANVLHNATPRSLVVLDEVGRGTSTYDGMAIARAVIEYLHEEPRLHCKTLFATHYHELTELEGLLPRVRNLRMDVLEEGDRVVFLHRVVPGGADRSYGIHVAQLAGVPAPVIRRARQILLQLEANGAQPAEAPAPGELPEPAHAGLVAELRDLDVAAMTPLQAIAKLGELQKRAR